MTENAQECHGAVVADNAESTESPPGHPAGAGRAMSPALVARAIKPDFERPTRAMANFAFHPAPGKNSGA
jgi:hypothetical protein